MNFKHSLFKAGLATGLAGFLAIGLFGSGRPALAFTPKASGLPGLVQVPVTQGKYQGSGWPTVTFPTRYVWRSMGSSDTQLITVTYRVWKYNAATGGWDLYNSQALAVRVSPSEPGAWITGWYFNVPFDSFAANVLITWAASDGTALGWKVIDYNTFGDYQCLTPSTCSVLPNASVGAFIYLHPAPQPAATQRPTQSTGSGTTTTTTTSAGNGTTGSTFNIPGTPNILKEYRFRDLDELENFALHGPHMRVYPTDMYEALNYGSVMPRDAYTTFGNMHFPVPD